MGGSYTRVIEWCLYAGVFLYTFAIFEPVERMWRQGRTGRADKGVGERNGDAAERRRGGI